MFIALVEDNFLMITLMVGMFIMLAPKSPFNIEQKHLVATSTVTLFCMTLLDWGDYYLAENMVQTVKVIEVRLLFASIVDMLIPLLIIVPLGLMVQRNELFWFMVSLEITNMAVYFINIYKPIAFWYDETGAYHRGIFGYTLHVIAGVLLLYLIYFTFVNYPMKTLAEMKRNGIVFFIPVVILVAVILSSISPDNINYKVLDPAIALCIMYYYNFLQTHHLEEYDTLQKETLKSARNELLTYQIKPHFLYNTMNVIYYLCLTDPEKAADTVDRFSSFLRENLELGSKSDQLIPFSKEIKHVESYTYIEMLRYDNITIEYDLQKEDFFVPSVCVQPIVENAIHHGVRNKEDGKIIIRSRESNGMYVISVEDNGIGYVRESAIEEERKHTGIGIKNIRERIERMTGGSLTVDMERGVGTTVTILIPKQ